jgi:hypothetical protein
MAERKRIDDWYTNETDNRPLIKALFYERDGDLNISQVLCAVFGIAGVAAFLFQIFHESNTLAIIAGWSFLGAAFMGLLIATIPISKAKILAQSKVPGEVAKAIGDVANNVETSTDVQEIYSRRQIIGNQNSTGNIE